MAEAQEASPSSPTSPTIAPPNLPLNSSTPSSTIPLNNKSSNSSSTNNTLSLSLHSPSHQSSSSVLEKDPSSSLAPSTPLEVAPLPPSIASTPLQNPTIPPPTPSAAPPDLSFTLASFHLLQQENLLLTNKNDKLKSLLLRTTTSLAEKKAEVTALKVKVKEITKAQLLKSPIAEKKKTMINADGAADVDTSASQPQQQTRLIITDSTSTSAGGSAVPANSNSNSNDSDTYLGLDVSNWFEGEYDKCLEEFERRRRRVVTVAVDEEENDGENDNNEYDEKVANKMNAVNTIDAQSSSESSELKVSALTTKLNEISSELLVTTNLLTSTKTKLKLRLLVEKKEREEVAKSKRKIKELEVLVKEREMEVEILLNDLKRNEKKNKAEGQNLSVVANGNANSNNGELESHIALQNIQIKALKEWAVAAAESKQLAVMELKEVEIKFWNFKSHYDGTTTINSRSVSVIGNGDSRIDYNSPSKEGRGEIISSSPISSLTPSMSRYSSHDGSRIIYRKENTAFVIPAGTTVRHNIRLSKVLGVNDEDEEGDGILIVLRWQFEIVGAWKDCIFSVTAGVPDSAVISATSTSMTSSKILRATSQLLKSTRIEGGSSSSLTISHLDVSMNFGNEGSWVRPRTIRLNYVEAVILKESSGGGGE